MRWIICTVVLVMLSIAGNGYAQEQKSRAPEAKDEVDEYFTDVAFALAEELQQRHENQVVVTFAPLAGSSSAGSGYAQLLAEKLKARHIAVVRSANLTFKGEFGPSEVAQEMFAPQVRPAPSSKPRTADFPLPGEQSGLALKLNGHLVNALGKPVGEIPFGTLIHDPARLAEALGASIADAHHIKDRKALDDKILDAAKHPQISLIGHQAQIKPDSQFAMEVLLNGSPVDLSSEGGVANLKIGLKQEYQIRLKNRADFEAAVRLTIDGIDSFHFAQEINPATGKPFHYILVPPAKNGAASERVVQGWFITTRKTRGFKIAPEQDSLAYTLGQTAEIGQITASFFGSWEEGNNIASSAKRPADEPTVEFREIVSDSTQGIKGQNGQVQVTVSARTRVGTTFGSERITNSQGVARIIGKLRDSITIHYTGINDSP